MEPTVRVGVTVTFLRMDRRPADRAPALPAGATVVEQPRCSVAFYRYLYDTVGAPYVWWLRRAMPDAELAAQLLNAKRRPAAWRLAQVAEQFLAGLERTLLEKS